MWWHHANPMAEGEHTLTQEPTARRQPDRKRPGAIRIAKIAGVPVYVNASWFLVALLIAYIFSPVVEENAPGLGVFTYVAAFGFAVLLYASVLLHEISHVVVARAFGLRVRAITVQFLGGMAEIEQEPNTPWREFAVAAVGPLTSLALGGLALTGVVLIDGPPLVNLLIAQLALANILVGLFNLLPGLPLDGGRMLRAAIWALTKRPNGSTTVAAWSGRIVAILVLLLPWLFLTDDSGIPRIVHIVWSVILGTFLWVGSTQALVGAKIRKRLPKLRARELARRGVPVPSDVPLSEAMRRAEECHAGAILVVDHEQRPVGIVKESAVIATPEQRRPWISVGDLARKLEPGMVLSADLEGEPLVRAMTGTPASEYLVVEPDGSVYGVLSTADVDRAFAKA